MKAFASMIAGLAKDSGLFAWLAVLHTMLIYFALQMLQPGARPPIGESEEVAAVTPPPDPVAGWFALIFIVCHCIWVAVAMRASRKDYLASGGLPEVDDK